MANQVFANGMEIACKAGAGKVIASFPDVCMTPPENPATPPGVPVPYPNTGLASDTTDGSKNVKISDKEIMLKNKSNFKKSTGDEAGCAAKKGVISSKNTGKVYFIKWSMDVKVEGENVDRHLDMTTNNHGSPLPNEGVPWPYVDTMEMQDGDHSCVDDQIREMEACSDCSPYGSEDPCDNEKCQEARVCMLTPFKPPLDMGNVTECCPGLGRHHPIPVGEFSKTRSSKGEKYGNRAPVLNDSVKGYRENRAPTVCLEGEVHNDYDSNGQIKEHGLCGNAYVAARLEKGIKNNQKDVKYSDLSECGAKSVKDVCSQCTEECIKKQLDNYHVKVAKIPADEPVCRASQQSTYKEYDGTKVDLGEL